LRIILYIESHIILYMMGPIYIYGLVTQIYTPITNVG